MMSKLQHVINYMDMYRILKETFLAWKGGGAGVEKHLLLYSYHMCMRATVSLSAPRQEPLHEGVSPRATVLVEGLTN